MRYLITIKSVIILLLLFFLIEKNKILFAEEIKPTINIWYKDKLINDKAINDPDAYKVNISFLNYPKANAIMISDKENFENASWEPVTYLVGSNVRSWQFPKNDGVKRIYIRFRNNDGTFDEIRAQYILDTTPPLGKISIGNKTIGPDRFFLTVYLNAEDNLSKRIDFHISKKNDFSDAVWRSMVSLYELNPLEGELFPRGPTQIIKEKNGQKDFVYVQYRDEAGNISETYRDYFIYDGSPPQLYVEVPPSDSLEQIITTYAYDEFSNLGKMFITNDPLFIENVVSMPYQEKVSWKFDDRRVVWVKIRDSVGNESEPYPAYLAPIVTFTPLPSWTPAPNTIPPVSIITIPKPPTLIPNKTKKYLDFKKKIDELKKQQNQLTKKQNKLEEKFAQQEKKISFLEEAINKIISFLKKFF